jgi:lysophospholipase L1-like esterase
MNIKLNAKRVMVYGDSLTWGRVANQFIRYDENTRWTAVAQQELGEGYDIIEEGLRGRFLAGENPFIPDRDGLKQFGPILASQFPLDLVVLFLGTNDTNSKANKTPEDIANALHDYFKTIDAWCEEFQTPRPKVLIVAPPEIDESNLKEDSMFIGGREKSLHLPALYEAIAKQQSAGFFDSSKHTSPGVEDGVHIDDESHKQLGRAIAPVIIEALV